MHLSSVPPEKNLVNLSQELRIEYDCRFLGLVWKTKKIAPLQNDSTTGLGVVEWGWNQINWHCGQ